MILVFGSINIDLVTRVERIPLAGETVIGPSYTTVAGGKGANQALAARRAGAAVAMIGAVGRDGFAEPALAQLQADGVDRSAVARVDGPTGAAFITVDDKGQNAICVAAGANMQVRATQLETLPLGRRDILLLQREVPDAEGEAAARLAKARGARVLLNLAPGGTVSPAYLALVDFLVMNEHEARILGRSLWLDDPDFDAIAQAVAKISTTAVLITLGAEGVIGFHKGARLSLSAFPVSVVDTTAAGDAFVGAFAAALDMGHAFPRAVNYGLAAGSLTCTRAGAQTSLPRLADIEAMVRTRQ